MLRPPLDRFGDARAVSVIECILEDGNAADRMRRVLARTSDLVHVMDWLRDETHAGLYRVSVERERERGAWSVSGERERGA
jgi:hypothetical protein